MIRYCQPLGEPVPLTAFHRKLRPTLRCRQLARVHEALQRFCRALDEGDSVLIAPEGQLNHGSELRPIRAGVYRLVHGIRRPITLLPVSICYTGATSDRPHVFVDVRRELAGPERLARDQLNQLVADRITPDTGWVAATLGLRKDARSPEAQSRPRGAVRDASSRRC